VWDEALEVPGLRIVVGGFAECDDPRLAWAEVLDDALDAPVLASRIAALENDEEAVIEFDYVPLELH
jgi:hypothetical protein